MIRTWCNLVDDSNPTIHGLLSQIEHRLNRYGALPPTLFLQVDGGSENINKYVYAICELLIARKAFKRIYLNRLPVGHTHEGTYSFLSIYFSLITLYKTTFH